MLASTLRHVRRFATERIHGIDERGFFVALAAAVLGRIAAEMMAFVAGTAAGGTDAFAQIGAICLLVPPVSILGSSFACWVALRLCDFRAPVRTAIWLAVLSAAGRLAVVAGVGALTVDGGVLLSLAARAIAVRQGQRA